MLHAIVNNIYYPIISGNINFELDAVSEFSIEIVASEIDWRNALYLPVEIVFEGNTLITGYVDKLPTLTVDENKVITINLDCVDDLGRLSCRRSFRQSHYQNQTLLYVLTDLMASIGDWSLDISQLSLASQNELITIDLRSKESLFAQLIDAIKSVPGVHLRFGGQDTTTLDYILEIGEFNEITSYVEKGFNLVSLTIEPQNNRVYSEVESYSGLSGSGKIRLNRAYMDARYLTSTYITDYPIIIDPIDNAYIVRNLTVNSLVSCSTRKSFDAIKTKNDVVPTSPELDDVSWTLYLKTIRFLQETDLSNLYTVNYLTSNLPKVGDRVRINAFTEEPMIDRITGQIMGYNPTLDISEDFRITRYEIDLSQFLVNISQNYNTSFEYLLNLTCSDNDELGYYDESVELYSELEKYESIND